MSTDHDRLINEEIEQSERTRNEPLPADAPFTQPNRNPSSVLTVRISSDLHDELVRLGKVLDVPPSTLARGFIMDRHLPDWRSRRDNLNGAPLADEWGG